MMVSTWSLMGIRVLKLYRMIRWAMDEVDPRIVSMEGWDMRAG